MLFYAIRDVTVTILPSELNYLNKLLLAIRKRNQLTIKNCREIFTKDKFCFCSTSIELFGFKWYLEATTKEKGFLALFLHAIPPTDFKGNYRIEIDRLVAQI
jgi:hypothetical protein